MRSTVIVERVRSGGARRALLAASIAVALCGVCVAQAQAQIETIPAAWQGVWNTTTVVRLCGNPTIISQETFLDTLCAGMPILENPGAEGGCSGTVTDTSVDYACSGTVEIEEGCTATLSFHLLGTRSGESYQVTETIETTFSAGCPSFYQDSCEELSTTATRTGDDPDCGQVPTELETWSSIKARFH